MKIAILHHDLEPTETRIKDLFESREISIDLVDIRDANFDNLKDCNIVINRVYSSIASVDYASVMKTLKLLKKLEKEDVVCLNSFAASVCDYSKYDLFKILSSNNVMTPPTLFVGSEENIPFVVQVAVSQFKFPIVVKRNCGGRAEDISRVYNADELEHELYKKFKRAHEVKYGAGFIIQPFIKSIRSYDCRIGVVNESFCFSFKRNFVGHLSKEKWLASVHNGSAIGNYEASEKEIEIALTAIQAINCFFGEIDIILTEKGPCVIEINPTPRYYLVDTIDSKNLEKLVNLICDSLLLLKQGESL
jgi:glutathione synthase/RimK-type ligase-like ATP-grasp enzyme